MPHRRRQKKPQTLFWSYLMVRISEVFLQIQRNYNSPVRRADYVISTTTTKFTLRKSITGHKYNLQRAAFRWTTKMMKKMSSLSWSVILLINEVFVQLRFSGEKKKHEKRNWSTSNHIPISSVKFHSSLDKGTRKQFMSRIILAQNPCHIVIKAFHSILTIAMCRCTIITLLLDFKFQFSFPCSFTEKIFTLCTDSM